MPSLYSLAYTLKRTGNAQGSLLRNKSSKLLTLPSIKNDETSFSSSRQDFAKTTILSPPHMEKDLSQKKSLLRLISSQIREGFKQNYQDTLLSHQKKGVLLDSITKRVKTKPS